MIEEPPATAALTPIPADDLRRRVRQRPGDPGARLLIALVGGLRAVNAGILNECTPGTGRPLADWLKLTEAEVLSARHAAQAGAETTGRPWRTLAIQALDRLISAPDPHGPAPTQAASPVAHGGAYLTAADRRAQAAFPAVQAGETWKGRQSGRLVQISEVTSQSVFVHGVGEYPRQRFHQVFDRP